MPPQAWRLVCPACWIGSAMLVNERHRVVHNPHQQRTLRRTILAVFSARQSTSVLFAPVKNRKEHDVPLAASLTPILTQHIGSYPPVPVTLPWKGAGRRAG